jgi:two-component system chemotaxis response regulator CheB
MADPIRTFVVDDSAVVRSVLRDLVEQDPRLAWAGEATDGQAAVALIPEARPDIVLMDVLMPRLDGLQATARLMADHPLPIVLMSDATGSDPELARSGLEAGAVEVMRKPTRRELEDPLAASRLGRKICALSMVPVVTRRRRTSRAGSAPAGSTGSTGSTAAAAATVANTAPGLRQDFSLVCIGASTGGPPAIRSLLADLGTPPVPVVIVQHMTTGFTRSLAAWLQGEVSVPIELVGGVTEPRPGRVYLAPDGAHLKLRGRSLVLDAEPHGTFHQPSIDVLFQSVVDSGFARRTLAVLLTGMGADGASGMVEICEAGGWTIAQDEASSVVYGMPKVARELGGVREVCSLQRIGRRIVQLVEGHSREVAP